MWKRIREFLWWAGETGRATYATAGILLTAFKYNLDRFIAHRYNRDWSPWHYLYPSDQYTIFEIPAEEQKFWGLMVGMALPFLYVGIILTVRRLQSIGLPVWLVLLFFVPVANVLFFTLLCLLPENLRDREGTDATEDQTPGDDESNEQKGPGLGARIIPESATGSAAMGILATVPVAFVFLIFSVWVLESYGWGLFIGVPFWTGLSSVLIYSYHERRSFWSCIGVSALSISFLGLVVFASAVEGFICLLMAAPIGYALGAMGAILGYFIQKHAFEPNAVGTSLVLLSLCVPILMGFEDVTKDTPPVTAVSTTEIVDAPREKVWKNVISFSELDPPEDPVFQTGIAYPTDAELKGRGVGAVRHCNFTTGAFVEPITVWDEPNRLAFTVEEQPPAMNELTPFDGVNPPHIDGFLLSQRGEFRLERTDDGQTRLTGTTWYRHRIWPVSYWKIFSNFIIQRIHRRVLEHIKAESEA